MVGQRPLAPLIGVRVPAPQQAQKQTGLVPVFTCATVRVRDEKDGAGTCHFGRSRVRAQSECERQVSTRLAGESASLR